MPNDIKEILRVENKDNRSNLWTFLIYPKKDSKGNDNKGSLPDDYLEIISSWIVPVLISPIHHKGDSAEELNEEKGKDHIHVLMYFGAGAKKSLEQVEFYSKQLNGTRPFMVTSRNGMIRYFIHKDHPEKEQFDINELKAFYGFEYIPAFENNSSDYEYYHNIQQIIKVQNLDNIFDLIEFVDSAHLRYEKLFIVNHLFYFEKYLNAIRYKVEKIKKREYEKMIANKLKD